MGTYSIPQFAWDGGFARCRCAGDALLSFACWVHAQKLRGHLDLFTAHPVPLSGFTSPGFRSPPLKCGREATEPRRPRSRRRGVVSRAHQAKQLRPLIGRRSSDKAFGSNQRKLSRLMCRCSSVIKSMQRRICDLAPPSRNFTPSRAAGSFIGAAFVRWSVDKYLRKCAARAGFLYFNISTH